MAQFCPGLLQVDPVVSANAVPRLLIFSGATWSFSECQPPCGVNLHGSFTAPFALNLPAHAVNCLRVTSEPFRYKLPLSLTEFPSLVHVDCSWTACDAAAEPSLCQISCWNPPNVTPSCCGEVGGAIFTWAPPSLDDHSSAHLKICKAMLHYRHRFKVFSRLYLNYITRGRQPAHCTDNPCLWRGQSAFVTFPVRSERFNNRSPSDRGTERDPLSVATSAAFELSLAVRRRTKLSFFPSGAGIK